MLGQYTRYSLRVGAPSVVLEGSSRTEAAKALSASFSLVIWPGPERNRGSEKCMALISYSIDIAGGQHACVGI